MYRFVHLCPPGRNVQVMFTMGQEVRQYRSWEKDYTDAVVSGRQADALDVDPVKQLVYWTDSVLRQINRAVVPKEEDETAIAQPLRVESSFAGRPLGISVDWVGE